MRILVLYRPRLPSLRAQAIQVVHSAHALALRGHAVTLLADRASGNSPTDVLAGLGLAPTPHLRLELAPTEHRGLAGMWFRSRVLVWWAGPPGVVLARDKRRLRSLLRLPARHEIAVESHELDSALASERGDDPSPASRLERIVVGRATRFIANCGGTLGLWNEAHGDVLPARRGAVHNATHPSRRRDHFAPDGTVRAVGTLRAFKSPAVLVAAARDLPIPVELVGGTDEERAALGTAPNVSLLPPLPFQLVPDLLARSSVLVLPLGDNLFGRSLTSPLKLWDYLATPTPLVLPDLPSIREIEVITGAPAAWYRPGDAASLVRAVREALASPPRTPFVRTWAERAAEVEGILA